MADPQQRVVELDEQVRNLFTIKRELEEKVEELTLRKRFTATLSANKSLYWIEEPRLL
jgi:hypothetical protein